jgi:hypothetical protein
MKPNACVISMLLGFAPLVSTYFQWIHPASFAWLGGLRATLFV